MSTFWDKGYAGTSAQDLVDATGLGRGSLYNAFKSKHDLFEAALRRYDEARTARLVKLLEEGEAPARERIRSVLLEVVDEETAEAGGSHGCLVVNSAMELAGRDPEVTAVVRDTFTRLAAAFAVCVGQGHRDGTMERGQDPAVLALHLLNTMYGLRVLGKVTDRAGLVAVVDQAVPPPR
jgi:TetR/AcrR family transcriptional repressor of nem operon